MTLFLNGTPLLIDTEHGQRALKAAHSAGTRIDCRCRIPAPEMYIAATAGKFIVKRMPGTGPDHAIDCASFLPPDDLSGLAQVQASAITEDPDDGTTTLKLGFPLRKNSKARPAPEMTGGKPTEAKVAPRKLTITSVLHFLWHEADLGKWYPRMDGKRFWGVIHSALRRAAAGKIVKGQDLSRILYVPEYFKVDDKAEIAARRNRIFANLRPATLHNDNSATLRMTKSARAQQGAPVSERNFVVTMGYEFDRTGHMTLEERWENPTGFCVNNYRLDEEAR